MPAHPEFAGRLQALKKRQGLTWREIAEATGVTDRAAQRWAEGHGISRARAQALADLFEVELETFWTPELEPPTQLDRIEGMLHGLLAHDGIDATAAIDTWLAAAHRGALGRN